MTEPPHPALDDHLRGAAPGDSLDRRVMLARVMAGMGVPHEEAPAVIGRFRVLARLGSGGMGTVYSAHDGRLDRNVAIKLLHDRADPDRRLAHEAQTLARLRHPNIVAVHEIGDFDGREYVAMELVDGGDLGMWMREQAPAWRELVGCFVAAGRGLAAAHGAGIVHRDFKPENVLIAREGAGFRVCVADFGLAGVHAPSSPSNDETGDVIGTPSFMAPEVGRGGIATPQSDQYSFCLSLSLALWGERPGALHRPALPLTSDRAPARVRRIVRRGLSLDPASRWPGMDPLCDALVAALRPRRGAAIAGLVVLTAVTVAGLSAPADSDACARQADMLPRVWQELGRDATLAAGTGDHPAWPAGAAWLVRRIDTLAPAIADRRAGLCERSAGPISGEAVAAKQGACLELAELGISLALERWFEHELPALEHVYGLLPSMYDIERCDEVGILAQEVAPPEDAAERVRAVRIEVVQAGIQARLEEHEAARVRLEAALVEARAIDHPPTTSRALIERARAMVLVGDPKAAIPWLRDAVVEAERGRADAMRIAALEQLARRLADVGEVQAGREALVQADAARARSTVTPTTELSAALLHGYVEHALGDTVEAHAQYSRAVELAREVGPAEIGSLYESLVGIGVLESDMQRFESARAHLREGLAVLEGLLGPDHPQLASVLIDIASVDYYVGDLAAADAGFRRALELRTRTRGPDDPRNSAIIANLAAIDFSRGRYAEALDEFRKVLALRERHRGVDDPDNAKFHVNISYCLGRLGDQEAAQASAMRALELREGKLGAQHPLTGKAHHAVGLVALRRSDHALARKHFEQAIAVARAVPVEADVYEPLAGLAEVLLAERDHAELARVVEPVIGRCNAPEAPAGDCAQLEFSLARAIVDKRESRAIELARAARARLLGDDVPTVEVRDAIDAWLARHPG